MRAHQARRPRAYGDEYCSAKRHLRTRTLTEKYQIRLNKEDSAFLHKMAEAWRCDPVDVIIRRALAELFARRI